MATERVCSIPGCGKPFVAKGYCRMHYMRVYTKGSPHREPTRLQQIMTFIEEVVFPHTSDECLSHPFSKNEAGYCFIRIGGKRSKCMTLHRYICELVNGPAPGDNFDAAHECGNTWCINGRHQSWKTRIDNLKDKIRHGTHIEGVKCHGSKLTEQQVREIREMSKSMTQREIARRLGLGYKHVWHVIHDTWKHVE